jgi:thiamine kinase-like enzyme
LKGYITSLRAVTPPRGAQIAAADYSACHDPRISSKPFGPFNNHEEFHTFLRWGNNENSKNPVLTEVSLEHSKRTYRTVLTHGDLVPRNIIVRKDRIAVIIDWEMAGWFPEYWEYTRAWVSSWDAQEWRDMLGVIMDVYDSELETERKRLVLVG